MNLGTVIVVVIALLCLTAVRLGRLKMEADRERDARMNAARMPQADNSELAELRERVRVLERIATDQHGLAAHDSRRVAAEIESLREPQKD